jgi:outer membrane protein OmpA-like peptidoglycan-associated protein
MKSRAFQAAICALGLTVLPAYGQDLTDDEILQRFLVQRDAYSAVRAGTGATRGLSIVTVDDLDGSAPGDPGAGPEQGTAADPDGSVMVSGGDTAPATSGDTVELATVAAADAPPGIDANQVGVLPEELQVNVRISFDYDSATIKADQQPVLDQMCRVMKASDIRLFRIMGHTDSAGSDDYNEKLSLLRAEEVKRRMVSDCGIDPSRLEAMGLGERFLFDKADPKGPENRRVEFQALS